MMRWPPDWACLCCARVGDPYWEDTGGEKVLKHCFACGAGVVTTVRSLEAIQAAYPGKWGIACVECYSTNRAPVEIQMP